MLLSIDAYATAMPRCDQVMPSALAKAAMSPGVPVHSATVIRLPSTTVSMRLVGSQMAPRQVAQMDDRYSRDVEWRFGEMRCPVTILWGEDDTWVPLADGRELSRRMAAPLDVVPNTRHLMQEDAPEAIIATALSFWQRIGR